DSKASFTAFMDYVNAGREEDGESALKKHIDSLGKHIRELHGKHYAEEYRKRTGRDAVDTVFMFVPSDHALQAALTKKPELWQEAVTNGVLLVSPSTLMVAVHIVDIGWRRVEFNRNTDAILLKAQHLLDAIKEFLSSFDDVGKSLEAARGSWEKARHKLMPTVSGRGATISDSARQMTKLGVKSTPSPKHKAAEKYLYAVEAEDREQPDSTLPNP
ncbi:MAG: DNA recombination protein RmuC, partial [Victivallales bacterium]|nr:DNA recombination protein RmuC [Victivallales bacterium]